MTTRLSETKPSELTLKLGAQRVNTRKRIGVGVFGVVMAVPAYTWSMLGMTELSHEPVLGSVDLLGGVLAALAAGGAFLMQRWTAYAFGSWVLLSTARGIAVEGPAAGSWWVGAPVTLVVFAMWLGLGGYVHMKISEYRAAEPRGEENPTLLF